MPGERTGLGARSYSVTEAGEEHGVQREECGEEGTGLRLGASLPRVNGQCEVRTGGGRASEEEGDAR